LRGVRVAGAERDGIAAAGTVGLAFEGRVVIGL
jgi:hypothetical protein